METRDLTLKIKADTKGLKDIGREGKKSLNEVDKGAKKAQSTFGRLTETIKANKAALIGIAAGAAVAFIAYRKIAGSLSEAVTASAAQIETFTKLEVSLANVGVKYDDVKDSLDEMFTSLQRTTVFGDTDSAEALAKLTFFTGDYEKALQSLQPAMDFAAGANISLETTSKLLGQALGGNVAIVARYIPELKGMKQETFDALSSQEQMEIVLGAVERRFGGVSEAIGNTYVGAVAQLKNAQGDLQEAIGDFITQSPVVIALIQTLADTYLNAAGRVSDYRKEQDATTEKTKSIVNGLIDIAEGAALLGQAIGVLGNLFGIIFQGINVAIQLTQNVFLGWQKRVIDGIIKINSILPDRLKLIDEKDVALFKSTSDRLAGEIEEFADTTLRGAVNKMQGAIDNFADSIDNLGDTSFFDDFRKRFGENFEKVIESMEKGIPVTEAFAGGTKEIGEEAKGAAEKLEEAENAAAGFVNTLAGKLDDIQRQIDTFGLDDRQLIFFETEELKEQARSIDGIGDALDPIIDLYEKLRLKLLDLKEAQEASEKAAEDAVEAQEKAAEEQVKKIEESLEGIKEFSAAIVTQITDTFTETLFNALRGNFDSIGDLFKQLLDDMLKSFLRFAVSIAANPIRIALNTALSAQSAGAGAGGGGIPGAGGGGGILGGLGGLLGGPLFGPSGSFTALGNVLGFGSSTAGFAATLSAALPAIGIILAAIAIAIPLLQELLKKKPKIDIDIGVLKQDIDGEIQKRGANVQEFLDALDAPNSDLARDIVRFSQVQGGVGVKGKVREDVRKAILTVIGGTIDAVQAVIDRLPQDVADRLTEELLKTEIDIEDFKGNDKLLEFDQKGKKAAEKLQEFIEGNLAPAFLESIRGFFEVAFVELGALPEAAAEFIDKQFEEFQNAGSDEERAVIGTQLLEDFEAVVRAFNILEGHAPDGIGGTVRELQNLSDTLGFEAVPSIQELDAKLEELISATEFDPSVIADMLRLRDAITSVQLAIISSISNISSKISQLNSTLGGGGFDLAPFLNEGLNQLQGIIEAGGLTSEQVEALLDEGAGLANQLLAEEQAAFQAAQQAAQAAAQAAADAARARIQAEISGLQEIRRQEEENFNARLEALNEELRLAEAFKALAESIQATLDNILLGPDSVFTAVERLNLVQADIAGLQQQIAATTDPEKQLQLAEELQGKFESLFELAGEAFGVNSPEFVSIFGQVTEGLSDLKDLTESRGRSTEEIQAEIEALAIERNARLEAIDLAIVNAQERLANVQVPIANNTFQMSEGLREQFEFLRGEYVKILEERFEQLGEVSELGFETELEALGTIAGFQEGMKDLTETGVGISEEMLIELRRIAGAVGATAGAIAGGNNQGFIPNFAEGTGGFQDFGKQTLAFLHGKEAVIPLDRFAEFFRTTRGSDGGNIFEFRINVEGGSRASIATTVDAMEDRLVRTVEKGGRLRTAIQDAAQRRLG